MRLAKNLLVFYPDRGQGIDVEKTPIVDLLVSHTPIRKPIVLRVEQFGERKSLSTTTHGEDVIVVAHYLRRTFLRKAWNHHVFDGDLTGGKCLADAAAEHGHEQPLAGVVERNIKPGAIRRLLTITEG